MLHCVHQLVANVYPQVDAGIGNTFIFYSQILTRAAFNLQTIVIFPLVGSEEDPGHPDTGQATTERRDGRGFWPEPPGLHRDGQPYAGTDSGSPAAQEVRVPGPSSHAVGPPPPPPRLTDRHRQTDTCMDE